MVSYDVGCCQESDKICFSLPYIFSQCKLIRWAVMKVPAVSTLLLLDWGKVPLKLYYKTSHGFKLLLLFYVKASTRNTKVFLNQVKTKDKQPWLFLNVHSLGRFEGNLNIYSTCPTNDACCAVYNIIGRMFFKCWVGNCNQAKRVFIWFSFYCPFGWCVSIEGAFLNLIPQLYFYFSISYYRCYYYRTREKTANRPLSSKRE